LPPGNALGKRWREGKRRDIVISMSKLLEDAIKKVRELPEADQDEAAEMLLSVASRHQRPVRLDDDTRAAIEEGRAQARRGEFVSDKDIGAFFKRHGVKPRGA
jgi:predicted transcriptional regulator